MKRKIVLLFSLTIALGALIAFQNQQHADLINVSEAESHIELISKHMTSFAVGDGDIEVFKKDNEAFNAYLRGLRQDDYVSAQLNANKIRLKGVVTKDMDLITKSSELQDLANSLLWEIKEEN